MKTKRLFAVVAAIVAICLVIAGCGGNTTTETGLNIDKSEYSETNGLKLPISEDGEVIEVMAPSSVEGLDKKVFAQAVKELTGIEIKYSLVASSNYGQKLKMLLSSKQLPDVFASSLGRAELDYVAVYPLADSFSAELSDVSSTGAILKTNMPISTKNAALKVGENNVTVAKEANSVNTYKLAFATPLSGGSFTLAGKVNALAYATNVDVNIDFDYEFEFEKAEALYFDNFDRVLADGKSEVFVASANSSWAKYFPIIARENGKLKITNTEDLNYAALAVLTVRLRFSRQSRTSTS